MNSEDEFCGINGDKSFVEVLMDRIFTSDELRFDYKLCPIMLGFIEGKKLGIFD